MVSPLVVVNSKSQLIKSYLIVPVSETVLESMSKSNVPVMAFPNLMVKAVFYLKFRHV